MNLLFRHNAIAAAKPQNKTTITVTMVITLNLKNDFKKHIIFLRALQFRNKITCKIQITKHYIFSYPDVG